MKYAVYDPLWKKCNVIQKTGNTQHITTTPKENRVRTTRGIHKKLVKTGHTVPETSVWINRQIDKLITKATCSPTGVVYDNKLIKVNKTNNKLMPGFINTE